MPATYVFEVRSGNTQWYLKSVHGHLSEFTHCDRLIGTEVVGVHFQSGQAFRISGRLVIIDIRSGHCAKQA